MSKVIIVVPCHDEAARLDQPAFRQFVCRSTRVNFLFVNDGSHDTTLDLLHQLAANEPSRFEVLNLTKNQGKAEAVRQGVLQAGRSMPEYIGYWDADLATPLDEIPGFVAVLDRLPQIALVMGARVPLLGHKIQRRPLRRWLGKIFARIASFALGISTFDTQCGAKLFRATPELLAAFSHPFGTRWIFDVELLARLICMRRETPQAPVQESVYEFPLDHWEDVAGSKLKRSDFFKAAQELAAIWRRYLRPGAPLYVGLPLVIDGTTDTPAAPIRRAA